MAVVTPLNNFLGPEGDTVTVDEQLLNTEYWVWDTSSQRSHPSLSAYLSRSVAATKIKNDQK